MKAVILTQEQYDVILKKLDQLTTRQKEEKKEPSKQLINNNEFLKMMGISRRTAQIWRDEGIISFSQIKGKIYYKRSDIDKMIDANYNPSFKTRSIRF